MSVLLLSPDVSDLSALAAVVRLAGYTPAAQTDCHKLVRDAVRTAPEAVLLLADTLDEALQSSLALLQAALAVPVVWVGARHWPEGQEAQWPALGLAAWLPAQGPGQSARLPEPEALAAALRWGKAQHTLVRRLQAELQDTQARLDERRWLERAKGMLMQHQQLSEDHAFSLLRTASMHANLRVGEVSRALVETAQAADAVNRAGQLRMLSQRLLRCQAQQMAGIERHRAEELAADTVQRLRANLQALEGLQDDSAEASALAEVHSAWQALLASVALAQGASAAPRAAGRAGQPGEPGGTGATPALASTPPGRTPGTVDALPATLPAGAAQALADADACAEGLLEAADRLTLALERRSGRAHMAVVNTCGRQRMLCQRLGKQALLATLLPEPAASVQAAAAAQTMAQFDQALARLEAAPLTTEAIRAGLAQVRGQWQRLRLSVLRPAPAADLHSVQLVITRDSEALLQSFEALTSLYEHSMQLLLG